MTTKPLGFIFDLDGTIVDSTFHYREVWADLVREFGTTHDPDALMRFSARDGLRIIFGPNSTEEQITALVRRQAAMGRDRMRTQGVKAQAGIRELITGLHERGVRLAVATLAEYENADWCLKEIGVRDFFPVLVSDNDVSLSKPHPAVYLEAIKKLGLPTKHCAAMEDSPTGVKSAKNAGLRCIGVLTTHTRGELAQADWIVEDLTTLTPDEVIHYIES